MHLCVFCSVLERAPEDGGSEALHKWKVLEMFELAGRMDCSRKV